MWLLYDRSTGEWQIEVPLVCVKLYDVSMPNSHDDPASSVPNDHVDVNETPTDIECDTSLEIVVA